MKIVLLGLWFGIQAHAEMKDEMMFTPLHSAVQMRSLQAKFESICKLIQKNCFVHAAMFDAVPAGKTALEISYATIDHQIFGKAHSEKSDAAAAFKLVLKNSGIRKSKDSVRIANEILNEIKTLAKSEDIEIISSVLYSSLTNEKMLSVVLKNKKFQNAELITFGAGECADVF